MSEEDALDEADSRIREIYEARNRLLEACDKRSLSQLMREGRRLAKREKRLFDYLSFSYTLEESCTALVDGTLTRDLSIEIIGLLEDEDKARAFGPDFDLDRYEYCRNWMLPLIYKALADVTGEIEGFNSPGMHSCIAEGISVCRRMSYREGIINFREFAFEVYQAADDLDMALHFARETIALQTADENRKVASADDAARALGLQGRITEAVQQVMEGWEYCEAFHHPYMAKLNFLPLMRETFAVAGRTDLLAELPELRWPHELQPGEVGNYLVFAPRGSDPSIEASADRALAVEAACKGDYDKAIALLEPWAQLALKNQIMHPLLENRCRLMALYRLSGRMDDLHAMAKATEPIAKQANDWLTMHTIKCMLDESFPANPLASVAPADCGPFAPVTSQVQRVEESITAVASDAADAQEEAQEPTLKTPLTPYFHTLYERLDSEDEQAPKEVLENLLALSPMAIEESLDGEQALNAINYLADAAHESSILEWSRQLLTRFPGESGIASMTAVLWNTLRELTTSDGKSPIIAQEDVQKQFLRALDMDPECGRSFTRAGLHYLSENDLGEAERCLARAFRLNRRSAASASGLADVYANTGRLRDSLAVLDMALREGCEEPRLAWHAAMHASALDQFKVMLTYLDWYEERVPEQKWLCLYRAMAFLELNQGAEALEQIEREQQLNPESHKILPILAASAYAQLDRLEDFRSQLQIALDTPLREADIVSSTELTRLMARLWTSAKCLPIDDSLRLRLESRLLRTCMAPAEYFELLRVKPESEQAAITVRLYRVFLGQVLDDDWPASESCLSGEETWKAYNILWCVLAEDEEKATQFALEWQAKCEIQGSVEVLGASASDEVYTDFPGVVSQGPRGGLVEKSDS